MLNLKKMFSPALLSYPKFKTEDGKNYKLDHFEMTDDGAEPVYVETEELSMEQIASVLMGEEL